MLIKPSTHAIAIDMLVTSVYFTRYWLVVFTVAYILFSINYNYETTEERAEERISTVITASLKSEKRGLAKASFSHSTIIPDINIAIIFSPSSSPYPNATSYKANPYLLISRLLDFIPN